MFFKVAKNALLCQKYLVTQGDLIYLSMEQKYDQTVVNVTGQ